jgi:hypothetical protein
MNSKTTPGAGEEKKILERRINMQGLKRLWLADST